MYNKINYIKFWPLITPFIIIMFFSLELTSWSNVVTALALIVASIDLHFTKQAFDWAAQNREVDQEKTLDRLREMNKLTKNSPLERVEECYVFTADKDKQYAIPTNIVSSVDVIKTKSGIHGYITKFLDGSIDFNADNGTNSYNIELIPSKHFKDGNRVYRFINKDAEDI